jgi:S-DNA-T family DNA segregation ATPase FtsK/SpoIIIE
MIALPSLRFPRPPVLVVPPPAPTMPPCEAMRVGRIRTALAAVGIQSRPGTHVQGPRVTVYRFLVPTSQMERAVRRTAALEAALDTPGISIRQHGSWLIVEVPRQDPRAIPLTKAGPVLGVSATGEPVRVSLSGSTPHAVIGAQTGAGKTELLRTLAILESRQPQTRLVLLDMEGTSWEPFQGTGHLVASDPREVDAALCWAVDRLGAEPDGWRVVVMVDEAQMLSPFAQGLLREIAERGRKHAVHLVVATQYIRQDVLDRRLTSNAPIRIAGRVNDATASKQVLGMAGAERLLGRGDMLMVVGGAQPVRFQACLPGEADWQRIGRVDELELGSSLARPAAAAVHPGHALQLDWEAMIQWAIDNATEDDVASGAAIRRAFGCGSSQASKARDLARERAGEGSPPHPLTPATILRPDFAARAVGQ